MNESDEAALSEVMNEFVGGVSFDPDAGIADLARRAAELRRPSEAPIEASNK